VEETFDGWVRILLDEGCGWVLKDARGRNKLNELIIPVGRAPYTASDGELAERAGPQEFEVVFNPAVVVRSAPDKKAEAMGMRRFGQKLCVDSQTYHGWVRLADGGGWMLVTDPHYGDLIRCRFAEEEKAKREELRTALLEVTKCARSDNLNLLQCAVNKALTAGAKKEELKAAEDTLARLQKHQAERQSMRQKVLNADGNAKELRACIEEAIDAGFREEKELAERYLEMAKVREQKLAQEQGDLLQNFAEAAASGDPTAIKRTRDACKKGGVPTKEIARLFALHSKKDTVVAAPRPPAASPAEAVPVPAAEPVEAVPSPAAAPVEAVPAPAAEPAEAAPAEPAVAEATPAEAAPEVPPAEAPQQESEAPAEVPAEATETSAKAPAEATQAEEAPAPCAEPCEHVAEAASALLARQLDGEWFGKDGELMATIQGSFIDWVEGPKMELRAVAGGRIACEMFDQVFEAELDAQNHLVWSDGDVWTRVMLAHADE